MTLGREQINQINQPLALPQHSMRIPLRLMLRLSAITQTYTLQGYSMRTEA